MSADYTGVESNRNHGLTADLHSISNPTTAIIVHSRVSYCLAAAGELLRAERRPIWRIG